MNKPMREFSITLTPPSFLIFSHETEERVKLLASRPTEGTLLKTGTNLQSQICSNIFLLLVRNACLPTLKQENE